MLLIKAIFMIQSTCQSLRTWLKLNPLETAALQDFSRLSDQQKRFFVMERLNTPAHYELIAKFAIHNEAFHNTCQLPEFNCIFFDYWCTLGFLCSNNQVLFYRPQGDHGFDFFMGIFFYHQSLTIRNTTNTHFSFFEVEYIKEAVKYKSVHAIQRLLEHHYTCLNRDSGASVGEREGLHANTIQYCRSLFDSYGSYAYLMYIESLIFYAHFLVENNQIPKAIKCFEIAKITCDPADINLQISQQSIHNASFGEGLGKSNRLGFLTPTDAREYIEHKLQYLIDTQCQSFLLPT